MAKSEKAKRTNGHSESVAVLDEPQQAPAETVGEPDGDPVVVSEQPAKRTRNRKPREKEQRELPIGSLHLIRSGKRYCEVKVVGTNVDGGYFVRNNETGRSFLVEDTARLKSLDYVAEDKGLLSLRNKLAKLKKQHENTVMRIEDLNSRINDAEYRIANYGTDVPAEDTAF